MGDAKLGGAITRENALFFYPEDPSITSSWDPPETGLVLITDKTHALWDPRLEMPLLRQRIDNFKVFGVREPIGIRKNLESGQFEVFKGRRRVQHLRAANVELVAEGKPRRTIPCIRRQFSDREAVAEMAIENGHREEESPYDQAIKLRQLINVQGYTVHDASLIYGLSEDTIKKRLALLDMIPEFQTAVITGQVAPSTAVELAAKSPTEQREALTAMLKSTEAFAPKIAKRRSNRIQRPAAEVSAAAAARALGKAVMLTKKPIQEFLTRPDVHPVARVALSAVIEGKDLVAMAAELCGWEK
jgi:ParB family chromosome partitioning protein